jgi:hypothetical protein
VAKPRKRLVHPPGFGSAIHAERTDTQETNAKYISQETPEIFFNLHVHVPLVAELWFGEAEGAAWVPPALRLCRSFNARCAIPK